MKKLYYLIEGKYYEHHSIIIVSGYTGDYYRIEKVIKGDHVHLKPNLILPRSDIGIKKLATSDSMEEIMEIAMMEVL